VSAWDLRTGVRKHHLSAIHPQGVTSVRFSLDGLQVLTASFDTTLKLSGLQSGRVLKEFRGHTSFVNQAIFVEGGASILSASSDGTLRVWDVRTTHCTRTLYPHQQAALPPRIGSASMREISAVAVYRILPLTGRVGAALAQGRSTFLVCSKSPTAHLLTMEGEVVGTVSADRGLSSLVDVAASPAGRYLYAATEAGGILVFRSKEGTPVTAFKVGRGACCCCCCWPGR
jgi:WD40 repeat-containing protein SMU1